MYVYMFQLGVFRGEFNKNKQPTRAPGNWKKPYEDITKSFMHLTAFQLDKEQLNGLRIFEHPT